MNMRAQRLPEVPGKPLRPPWGALGPLQGAVGVDFGASRGTPGSSRGTLRELLGRLWEPQRAILEPFGAGSAIVDLKKLSPSANLTFFENRAPACRGAWILRSRDLQNEAGSELSSSFLEFRGFDSRFLQVFSSSEPSKVAFF